jgi:hypothetical protein
VSTIIGIPSDVFKYSGQSRLDTFVLELERVAVDLDRCNDVAVNGLRSSLEAIRKKTNDFAYWQRRCRTGDRRTRSARSSFRTSYSSFSVSRSARQRAC